MSAELRQNGIAITSVKPGSAVQLVGHDIGIWTAKAEFVVVGTDGREVLRQWVSVRFSDGWLDWQAPLTPGWYTFYAGADSVMFEVSPTAVVPSPRGYEPLSPDPTKPPTKPPSESGELPTWAIPAAVGGGLLLLLLVMGGGKKSTTDG